MVTGRPLGRPRMDVPILEAMVFEEATVGRLIEAHGHPPVDSNVSHLLDDSYPMEGDPSPSRPSGHAAPVGDNMFMNTSRGRAQRACRRGPFPLAPRPLSRLSWHRWRRRSSPPHHLIVIDVPHPSPRLNQDGASGLRKKLLTAPCHGGHAKYLDAKTQPCKQGQVPR
jgi:hypothetical protein